MQRACTCPRRLEVCRIVPRCILWAITLLCCMAYVQSSSFSADMLLKAVNQVYEPGGTHVNKPPAEYKDWLHEVPARLHAHKVWWSSNTPADATLTVATVTNLDRLYQLEAQCSSWAGPLSAVVYVPITTQQGQSPAEAGKALLADAERKVMKLVTKVEQAAGTGCYLDVQLLYEAISPDPLMGTMFPVNSLRNFALMAARTPLVAMIDVDLLVSSSMAEWLKAPDNTQQLLQRCKDKAVVVLPAFETEEFKGSDEERHLQTFHKVAAVVVQFDKRTVLAAMRKQGLIQPFDVFTHPTGHADTDYDRWDNSSQMYVANLTSPEYEPWFIIGRHQVPLYDVRYRGFGKNKMVHIQILLHQGYQFHVHPEAFLVHRPHPRGEASRNYIAKDDTGVANNAFRRNMSRLYDSHMEQLQSGTYRPCVDDALLNCHNTLPWAFKIPDPKCIPYVLPEDRDKPFNTSDDLRVERRRKEEAEKAAARQARLAAKAAAAAAAGGGAGNAFAAAGAPDAQAGAASGQASSSGGDGGPTAGQPSSGASSPVSVDNTGTTSTKPTTTTSSSSSSSSGSSGSSSSSNTESSATAPDEAQGQPEDKPHHHHRPHATHWQELRALLKML